MVGSTYIKYFAYSGCCQYFKYFRYATKFLSCKIRDWASPEEQLN